MNIYILTKPLKLIKIYTFNCLYIYTLILSLKKNLFDILIKMIFNIELIWNHQSNFFFSLIIYKILIANFFFLKFQL